MKRLIVHVEGETEEAFVNEMLAPDLYSHGYEKVSARLMGNARMREKRGGIRSWQVASGDISRHIQEDSGCVATTMVDYYALPATGTGAWPGRSEAVKKPFGEKASLVQSKLKADFVDRYGKSAARRFVPFVMMHEFEGLLFSDCKKFASAICRDDLAEDLLAIRNKFGTPEEINDSPTTAPSKRIINLCPEYQKPLFGTIAILEIGLEVVSQECPNFLVWLETLRAIPKG